MESTQLIVLIPDLSFTGAIYFSNKYFPDIRNITYFGKAQPLNLKVYTPENIEIISNININAIYKYIRYYFLIFLLVTFLANSIISKFN